MTNNKFLYKQTRPSVIVFKSSGLNLGYIVRISSEKTLVYNINLVGLFTRSFRDF